MTNAEKYLKPDMKIAMWKDYNFTGQKCKSIWQWLDQEAKPQLTEDEKVILSNIDKRYKQIRKIDGELQICTGSPSYNYHLFIEFDHLFQFIKERRRIRDKRIIRR